MTHHPHGRSGFLALLQRACETTQGWISDKQHFARGGEERMFHAYPVDTHKPTRDGNMTGVDDPWWEFIEQMGHLLHLGAVGMNPPLPILMDVDQHASLSFPQSLPEFKRLFADNVACAD